MADYDVTLSEPMMPDLLERMVVNGVSTSFSKSTVSRLVMGLKARVNAFRSRRVEKRAA